MRDRLEPEVVLVLKRFKGPGRVVVARDWDLLRVRSGGKGRRSATGVVDRMS